MNDVLLTAYLMHYTGYDYRDIYVYLKTIDYYFSYICIYDEDENPVINEKEIVEYLENNSELKDKVKILYECQKKSMSVTLSLDDEYELITEMLPKVTNDDFYKEAKEYYYDLENIRNVNETVDIAE